MDQELLAQVMQRPPRQQASGNDVASLVKERLEKPKAAPAGMHEPMGDMDF